MQLNGEELQVFIKRSQIDGGKVSEYDIDSRWTKNTIDILAVWLLLETIWYMSQIRKAGWGTALQLKCHWENKAVLEYR